MRKRFLVLVAVAVVAVAAAACGDDDGDGGGLDLVESGTLTVCTDMPYAPFEFEEGGETKGVDVDLVRAMAEKLDLEARFRDTDFDGIFAALRARQCDMIASSVTITDERKQENDFTDGYFEINQSLLVRKGDEAKYDDLADLQGKVIGVQSETTGADYARANAQGAEIKEFTGADELFTALQARQIEAVLQDLPVNAYNAETTGETVVSKVFEAEEKEVYGFVVRKGNTELVEALNEALQELEDDGTYDSILEEYLGEQATGT